MAAIRRVQCGGSPTVKNQDMKLICIFYLLGSICLLVGSILMLIRNWK